MTRAEFAPNLKLTTMTDEIFQCTMRIERPAAEVFAWHERPGAFARLNPPWERVEVTAHHGGIRDGARVTLRTKVGPAWAGWEILHRDYIAGRQFRDVQVHGPFAKWEHLHLIEPAGPTACVLTDEIHYRLPGGVVGRWGGAGFVRRKLERTFAYRHAVTKADLERAQPGEKKRVLISGGSGLIGRALTAFLQTQGHEVRRLVRSQPQGRDEFRWHPAKGEIDPAALAGVDAVVNLSGENIAGGRWTAARKAEILASRLESTRTLASAIAALAPAARPEVLVSASGVGFYGERGDDPMGDEEKRGTGFLADVVEAWEREALALEKLGLRTVCVRTGVVLTPAGGALAKMAPIFRAGLGGRIGSGRQWMSWIGPDDLLAIYTRAICDRSWRGAFNAVAPGPVTNAEFAATLGRVLHRPAVLPLPAWALRFVFGQMGEETVLGSVRAVPGKLEQTGFSFRQPSLEGALRHVLGLQTDGSGARAPRLHP